MSEPRAMVSDTGETTIHDLGYRRYEGARVGARGAWTAVYWQGLRATFGLGRSAKSKIVPVFVLGFSLLQALGRLAVASASGGQVPISYGMVFGGSLLLYVLFIAAQAPEVLSRDQQHRVLPLVLTRAITRAGYASARLVALMTAVFALVFMSLLLLYIGEIGIATDPSKAFTDSGSHIFPVLGLSLLTATMLGGVGAGVAACTPRRAYATAAIIAIFLVLAAIASGIDDLSGLSARSAELIDPVRSLRMLAMLMFDESNRGMELDPPLSSWAYAILTVGVAAVGVFVMLWRMRRVTV